MASRSSHILWTRALTRRLRLLDGPSTDSGSSRNAQDRGIICLSVHPGQIATEGSLAFAKRMPWPLSTLYRILVRWLHGTPAEGAKAGLFAIAAPQVREDVDKYASVYLEPVGKITTPTTKAAQSNQLVEDLWALTGRVLAEEGL